MQTQADTGRHRQTHADTCRHRQTQAYTGRHMHTQSHVDTGSLPEGFCMAAPEDKFSAVAPNAPGADPPNVPDDPPKIGCAPPNVSWLVVAGLLNRPVLCCSDTIPPPNTLLVVVAGLPNNPVPAELPPNVPPPRLPAPLAAPNSPVVGLVEGLPTKAAFDGVDPNKPD